MHHDGESPAFRLPRQFDLRNVARVVFLFCLALGLWRTVGLDTLLVIAFLATVVLVVPLFPLVIALLGKPDRDW
jgi:hypothetical protein